MLQHITNANKTCALLVEQQSMDALLEQILVTVQDLSMADGATLYLMTESRDALEFAIMRTRSLGLAYGGTTGTPPPYPNLSLYANDKPTHHLIAVECAHRGVTLNIADAYKVDQLDFTGTRDFDEQNHYRTQSVLNIPLKGHHEEVVGVIQLINAQTPEGNCVPFSAEVQADVERFAAQTALLVATQRIMQKGVDSDGAELDFLTHINKLNEIGIALSSEKDTNRLLEKILLGSKELANADAGTLYRVNEAQDALKFEIIRTDSLNIAMGGTTGVDITFPNLPLYKEGKPNLQAIAAYAAIKGEAVNVPDAYQADGFDFSGARAFDKNTGYRTTSVLAVPMKNHENELIGVLQLINAKDHTGKIVPFGSEGQQLAESLASQAAIALTTQKLINDLKLLFEAFIQAIAGAIDDKSPYTGGHCHRVPVLAEMLGKATSDMDRGEFKDWTLNDEQMYELKIAAWLHDCGKVTTPTEVVDKGTKLETIYDRIHTVDTRFEVLKRDAKIRMLEGKLAALEKGDTETPFLLEERYHSLIEQYDDDREFIRKANIGGEFMAEEAQQRVRQIGQYRYLDADGEEQEFLSDNEVYNLNIPRGTITPEEREIINSHVVATIKMLSSIPFPKQMKDVPEIAGNHHETLIGTGYPNKLTKDRLSVQARIMAIADVFEALTARDRPYKDGKTLSQALKILGFMKKDQHIDPELFRIFIESKIYLEYAQLYLDPKQIDEVDHTKIPGYEPIPNDNDAQSA
ncbi:metal dependent phosphohydrolase [Magnetococcus marinus MC-1]|uniref:Metal dependent phosphohydrolase n=2 Tax=Magnetococcus TaxID=162171 RepID=A0L8S2_MAGMM|nr:metal dependent phosphohydrolase [Magnetococcus marinus MC-1]